MTYSYCPMYDIVVGLRLGTRAKTFVKYVNLLYNGDIGKMLVLLHKKRAD